jgi:hypothetical protein
VELKREIKSVDRWTVYALKDPKIRSMRVYKSLEDAPRTDLDGHLEEVLCAS